MVRFNPPPDWDAPADPKDWWRPDPAWPPAPPGWAFYLDDDGRPVAPPADRWRPEDVRAADTRRMVRRHRTRWIGGIAGAVVLAALAYLVVVVVPTIGWVTADAAADAVRRDTFAGERMQGKTYVTRGDDTEDVAAPLRGASECEKWWPLYRSQWGMALRDVTTGGDVIVWTRKDHALSVQVWDGDWSCRNQLMRAGNQPTVTPVTGTAEGAQYEEFEFPDTAGPYHGVRVLYLNVIVERRFPARATVDAHRYASDVVAQLVRIKR